VSTGIIAGSCINKKQKSAGETSPLGDCGSRQQWSRDDLRLVQIGRLGVPSSDASFHAKAEVSILLGL